MNAAGRVIIVANRLPVTMEAGKSGPVPVRSTGGLVTALTSILRQTGGCWVGWPGSISGEITARYDSIDLVPVSLNVKEVRNFYHGCSNEIVWPLFHDLQSRCNYDPGYWEAYCAINERFANVVHRVSLGGDVVWVHDYHLMLLAEYLRQRGMRTPIGYFHHIPFPSPDIFDKLPWRKEILLALLAYDLVGFQTRRDRDNFTACIRRRLSQPRFRRVGETLCIRAEGRQTAVGAFPVSIDFRGIDELARRDDVVGRARQIRNEFAGRKVLLGVDRLDYTKGILQRLAAVEDLLTRHEEWQGRLVMLQLVVPSREEIRSYASLKLAIERRVSKINGRFGRPGWMPVHFLYRSVPQNELVAMYAAADVAVVTPLKDGMNLVAKEYCASHTDEAGVLVLSEFAGAADELGAGAFIVNPNDKRGVCDTLLRALTLSPQEQRARMSNMRMRVRDHDVFRWRKEFFRSLRSDPIRPWRMTSAVSVSHAVSA